MTKYEELEEVHAEIRLKQLLWDSLNEWNTTVDEWLTMSFEEINPEVSNYP